MTLLELEEQHLKILYIPSGFKRIYQSFDESIMKELAMLKHEVKSFNALLGLNHLQAIIRSFRPEIILTMVGVKMPKEIMTWLNKQPLPTAIWLTEDPYYIDRTLTFISNYDYLFTIDTAALEVYQKNGHKHSYYLPLGVDPHIYRPITPNTKKKHDICLVGYPYPDRVRLIKKLLEKTTYKILVIGVKWDQYLSNDSSNRHLVIQNKWLPPETIVQYYHQSKIVLNTHRPYDLKENENSHRIINKSVNNRTFEIASCGAFQLIDAKADLTPHFKAEKEIISFHSDEDFIKKVDYYLAQPINRNEIAKNSQIKTLKEHTFKQRLEKLLNTLEI